MFQVEDEPVAVHAQLQQGDVCVCAHVSGVAAIAGHNNADASTAAAAAVRSCARCGQGHVAVKHKLNVLGDGDGGGVAARVRHQGDWGQRCSSAAAREHAHHKGHHHQRDQRGQQA